MSSKYYINQIIFIIVFICLLLGHTFDTQELLLALCSWITPDRFQGAICGAKNCHDRNLVLTMG